MTSASSRASSHEILLSFWTFHVAGWLAIALSMWLGVLSHVSDPFVTLLAKLWFGVSGGLISLLLRPIYRRLYHRGIPLPWLIAGVAVVSYTATVVWSGAHAIGSRAIRAAAGQQEFLLPSIASVFSGTLFFTFIMLAWSVLYFGIKYYRDREAERERAIRAESHAHHAELQALRYQLNPHFLFNTMNAISTLVAEHRNREAERMIARLSDFLRLTLQATGAPEVPLAEEIDFTSRYLDIEKIRFGDRLKVQMDVDPEVMSAHLPVLLLQPLVENAIRHGIAGQENGGSIQISAIRAGNRLLVHVEDDGCGLPRYADPEEMMRSGVGLSNIRARLDALYGDAYRFDLQRSDGGGCRAVLDLPYRPESGATPADAELNASLPSAAPIET